MDTIYMLENVRITLFDRGIFALLIKRGTRLKIKSVGSNMKHDYFKERYNPHVRHSEDKITNVFISLFRWVAAAKRAKKILHGTKMGMCVKKIKHL
jgi:hypothetical protein